MTFRLDFARRGLFAAVMLAVGALVAGCSGGSNSATPSPSQNVGNPAQGPERELARVTVPPGLHVSAVNLWEHVLGTNGHAIANQPMHALKPSNYSCPTDSQCVQNHGGATLNDTGEINVYVNPDQTGGVFPNTCSTTNCPPQQWGFPGGFEGRVTHSTMTTEMNQYVGGAHMGTPYIGYITMTDATIAADNTKTHSVTNATIGAELATATAAVGLTGYHYEYHLFYRSGQWICTGGPPPGKPCYSPGDNTDFVYCAFHGSATISAAHIIFSVEPWQMVNACEAPTNNIQNDTSSTLSHEMYESVSDPDGTAWFRNSDGFEIGDICRNSYGDLIMNPNSIDYNIQKEWNNGTEACDYGP